MRAVLAGVILGASLCLAAPSRADELLESRESPYNSIFVHERDGLIVMSFGHNRRYYTESIYNPKDERDLPVAYTRQMTAALAYTARTNDILEIGFGGGRTAWYLHRHLPSSKITSVELDPQVIALAKKYFGIREEANFDVVAKDGRLFLKHADQRFDLILIDAYRGPFVPFHLLTREFYQLVKTRLGPGGIVAQNIEPTTMLFDAAVATLASVFAHVDLYEARGNVVAVAYDGAARTKAQLADRAEVLQTLHGFRYPLPKMIEGRRVVKDDQKGQVLTDDFAPVEALKAIERHNAKLDDVAAAAR